MMLIVPAIKQARAKLSATGRDLWPAGHWWLLNRTPRPRRNTFGLHTDVRRGQSLFPAFPSYPQV